MKTLHYGTAKVSVLNDGSAIIRLPKRLLDHFRLKAGDTVTIHRRRAGGLSFRFYRKESASERWLRLLPGGKLRVVQPSLEQPNQNFQFPMSITATSSPRRLIPWLVPDFRRYIYRAVHACRSGRAIFFYYRIRGEKDRKLFMLIRYPASPGEIADARRSFAEGRLKRMRLRDLPSITPPPNRA